MDTVIGLGQAGCAIVDKFAQYSQYKTYKMDTGLSMSPTTFTLEECQKIEDYEKNRPEVGLFFEGLSGDILFVVGGGGKISVTSLSILQQLSHCNINVLYIKPDEAFLGNQNKMIHNLVFNVFQEYARSGVFERMYIVENSLVEKSIPTVSIKNYYNNLNDAIVSSLHMINLFNHIESVTDTFCELPAGVRISTIGFVDPKKNNDNLFGDIKNSLKRKMESGVRVSYGIFETDYDEDYIYCVHHTSVIQGQTEIGGSEDLPTSP